MALALGISRFPLLAHSLPITTRLLAAAGLAMLRGSIPSRRPPAGPAPGRSPTGCAAIPRKRVNRRELCSATFEQAEPGSAVSWILSLPHRAAMLERAHGRCYSQWSVPERSVYFSPGPFSFVTPPVTYQPAQHSSRLFSSLPQLHIQQSGPRFAAIDSRALWLPGPAKLAPN